MKSAAKDVMATLGHARIRSVALGDDVLDAQGLAFWFPSSRRRYLEVMGTYDDLQFDKRTGWTTYLGKYYG